MSELIVKDNALIQASYTLDTVEQRLILLAIAEARETGHGITENSLLQVHASSYINTFNVEKHTAYTVLRDASKSLFDRYVTYHDINPKTDKDRSFHCNWCTAVPNSAASPPVTSVVPRQMSCTSHRWSSSTALPPWYPHHAPTGTATLVCWHPTRR